MKRALIGIVLSITTAVLLAIAGSDGSASLWGLPLFALCGAIAFLVHWVVFIPSYHFRTEHYFDLTGSITYLSVVAVAVLGRGSWDLRTAILAFLIVAWTLRLGIFLFLRIKEVGKDDRFDQLKTNFLAFLMVWTLSGLWVFLTAAAALAAMTSQLSKPLGGFAVVGIALWLAGFIIETIADRQKMHFKRQPENRGKFIAHGLWAWSRHPNYFGEIILWAGVALVAFPVLTGWQHVALVSPVFVWFLLTRVSGIPLLEAKAEARWGEDPDYRAYVAATPVLLPRPPRAA